MGEEYTGLKTVCASIVTHGMLLLESIKRVDGPSKNDKLARYRNSLLARASAAEEEARSLRKVINAIDKELDTPSPEEPLENDNPSHVIDDQEAQLWG